MITIMAPHDHKKRRSHTHGCRGRGKISKNRLGVSAFTLVELIIAASLSVFLLAGVLSTVGYFAKTGISMGNYYAMGDNQRKMLQYMSRDIQDAEAATWHSKSRLELTLDDGSITYRYRGNQGTLERSVPGENSQTMASNLQNFKFYAYDINGNEILRNANDLTLASAKTKMIHITAGMEIASAQAKTSQNVISSRFMLRNKNVPAP